VVRDRGAAFERVSRAVDGPLTVLAEYAIKLYLAPNRRQFVARHIPDLIIVVVPMLRPLRVLRSVRLLRLLRLALLTGLAAPAPGVPQHPSPSGAELGVGDRPGAEPDRRGDGVGVRGWQPRGHHRQLPDALWWALTTIASVGYGDRFPLSSAGRAVAVVLMIAGIAMFGVITATIAASFVEQKAEEDLASRLDQIMERLDRIDAGLRAGEDQHALEHQHRCALGVQQGRRQRPGTRNPVSTIRRKRSWSCRRATGGAFSARCCRQKSASVGGRLPVISATRSCGRILGVCAWPRNANTHPGGSTPPWPPS
jgi:Ion channel